MFYKCMRFDESFLLPNCKNSYCTVSESGGYQAEGRNNGAITVPLYRNLIETGLSAFIVAFY